MGQRRNVQDYWKWAHIDLQNNWGENCNKAGNKDAKGRQYCLSEDLCKLYYHKPGGMPFIPWKKGT